MKGIIENFDLYAPKLVDKEEYFSSGHRACQGCGEALAIRLMCKALGKDTVITNATGCMEVISTLYPTTAWKLPWVHVAFPNSAAVGAGVSSALKVLRRQRCQDCFHRRRRRVCRYWFPGHFRSHGEGPRHDLYLLR